MRRSRLALLVALGTDNFGSGLFLPLALVYVVRVVGLPLGVAGTVVAVGTLAGLAAPPLAGRLVDRLGPRAVVIGAQVLQAAGAFVYLAANGAAATCVAAILLAAGQQSFYSALFALIADVSPPGPKDRSFAQVNMIRSGAFGAGALAAGILLIGIDDGGLRLAVTLNAVSFCVSAALLYWYVRDHHHGASESTTSSDSAPGVLRDLPYLALIVFTGFVVLPLDFFLVGVPVFALERLHTPEWVPGAILAVVTVIDSTCGTLAVRLTRHLSRPGAMMIGAALYVAWCLVSALAVVVPAAWQPGWLLAAALLLAAGTLMFMPRANALSEAAAPAASRGRYLAAFQFSFTIPGVAAPALVALFSLGDLAPWPVVAVASAVGLLGLRWLAPKLPTQATLAR
jgi:MFS family permease